LSRSDRLEFEKDILCVIRSWQNVGKAEKSGGKICPFSHLKLIDD
jgi:hypothetical protein